jgi:arsenite-transporting ATPase
LECELGSDPQPVLPNCWAVEIDPGREADEYIAEVKARVGDSAPPRLHSEVNKQIDAARVSPGAEEAAVFDRFTRIIDSSAGEYDQVVFDTAPTGQTLRLISLPELMTAWITGLVGQRKKVNALGRMWRNVAGAAAGDAPKDDDPVLAALEDRKNRFHRVRQLLTDRSRTAFVFVLIPERLPILETQRAVAMLSKYGIPVEAMLVNRVLPSEQTGAFLERRKKREAKYLQLARETFGPYPLYMVPLSDRDVVGLTALRRLPETVQW